MSFDDVSATPIAKRKAQAQTPSPSYSSPFSSKSPFTERATSPLASPTTRAEPQPSSPLPGSSPLTDFSGSEGSPSPAKGSRGRRNSGGADDLPTFSAKGSSSSIRSKKGKVTWKPGNPNDEEPTVRVPREDLSDDEPDGDQSADYRPRQTGAGSEPGVRRPSDTPQKRNPKTQASSIATVSKERALRVDPNHGFCLLTNEGGPPTAIQYCHILARATSAEELTRLEFHWGMKYFTLWIDTRFNLVPIRADLHNTMDVKIKSEEKKREGIQGFCWALVPHHEDIAKTLKFVKNEPQTKFKDRVPIANALWFKKAGINVEVAVEAPVTRPTRSSGKRAKRDQDTATEVRTEPILVNPKDGFRYFVLPLDYSESMRLTHFCREGNDQEPHKRFTHPFKDLGPLKSHIHPHFVIYAMGQKLAHMAKSLDRPDFDVWFKELAERASFGYRDEPPLLRVGLNEEALGNIREIYAAWSDDSLVPKEGSWLKKPVGAA